MPNNLVLLTGGTGLIGFRVLRHLIEYGYQVRVVVRSEAKATTLRENAALRAMGKESQYSFVQVPDFTLPGAFDEAVKDVEYIIHCAAPVPFEEVPQEKLKAHFVDIAVNGTLAVLHAAEMGGTVQRFVYLSSAIALIDIQYMMGMAPPPESYVVGPELRAADIPEPYPHYFVAYAASKIAAQKQVDAFVAEKKRSFDVVSNFPAYVIGRDELSASITDLMKTSNSAVLRLATGTTQPGPAEACGYISLDDTSLMLVLSLDKEMVPGNQGYCYFSGEPWSECSRIISRDFAEEVKSGLIPNTGNVESVQLKLDVERAKQVFGDIKFQKLDSMVNETVQQYIELATAQKTS